jgi:hypothetical protein
MDAFDQGIINSKNFTRARKLINRKIHNTENGKTRNPEHYTMKMLTNDIGQATESKKNFVRQAKEKEGNLFLLVDCINTLWRDVNFLALAREENLIDRPTLSGGYNYEQELGCTG